MNKVENKLWEQFPIELFKCKNYLEYMKKQRQIKYDENLASVKQNGLVLKKIPLLMRSAEIHKQAVLQNARSLQYVPESMITKELCEMAVEKNGMAIINVHYSLIKLVKFKIKFKWIT